MEADTRRARDNRGKQTRDDGGRHGDGRRMTEAGHETRRQRWTQTREDGGGHKTGQTRDDGGGTRDETDGGGHETRRRRQTRDETTEAGHEAGRREAARDDGGGRETDADARRRAPKKPDGGRSHAKRRPFSLKKQRGTPKNPGNTRRTTLSGWLRRRGRGTTGTAGRKGDGEWEGKDGKRGSNVAEIENLAKSQVRTDHVAEREPNRQSQCRADRVLRDVESRPSRPFGNLGAGWFVMQQFSRGLLPVRKKRCRVAGLPVVGSRTCTARISEVLLDWVGRDHRDRVLP
ncbi:hypothetical protein BDN72DRAFT_862656 [Pluteus cervinus]|uniref:Uncharacterized protein n=1 Tax=Pluteus cervinus TaxID=181527 RepID=A0ACD3AAN9_9AGAR|nr:hypothetical protein BDN72DRAFT_862656 [Pluteus cervinus]